MQDYRNDIKQAIEVLKRGGVILYPTDTVWGIGCDATRSDAVKKVFEIKRRADSKALITLMSNTAMLERYVDDVPDVAFELIDVATTPLTIVYDKGINLAPELLADDGSIGVRISTERFSSSLCREFRRPIVSTSANISGQPTPRTFTEISDKIKAAVDYVCTSRQEETDDSHKPSSVIKLSNNGQIKILRK
jgi:L-threonylcarbamoyladenylate synthase